MKLIVKIIISVIVAALATALTTLYAGVNHAAPILFVAFCSATVITALLVSIPAGVSTAKPVKKEQKNRSTPRPAAAKSGVRAGTDTSSGDGTRVHGQVKWFNVSKGFGFITKDDGEEIFVHFRSIRGGGRRGLRDGQQVTFIVADSDKGPQAEDVEGLD